MNKNRNEPVSFNDYWKHNEIKIRDNWRQIIMKELCDINSINVLDIVDLKMKRSVCIKMCIHSQELWEI